MKNIDEIENHCIEYYYKKNTFSGANSGLSKEEINILKEKYETDKFGECMHILIHGYIGLCKICQKKRYIRVI